MSLSEILYVKICNFSRENSIRSAENEFSPTASCILQRCNRGELRERMQRPARLRGQILRLEKLDIHPRAVHAGALRAEHVERVVANVKAFRRRDAERFARHRKDARVGLFDAGLLRNRDRRKIRQESRFLQRAADPFINFSEPVGKLPLPPACGGSARGCC